MLRFGLGEVKRPNYKNLTFKNVCLTLDPYECQGVVFRRIGLAVFEDKCTM